MLSESISIDVPLYLIPLNTYEQNYNAKMIENYHLGKIANVKDTNEIKEFIKQVPLYSNEIKRFRSKYYKNNWQEELFKVLESYNVNCK